MASFSNYIAGTNPFNLSGPPLWFQKELHEFDPSLVIMASRMGFFYRLAQRRRLNLPEKVVNDVLKEQADTRVLAAYGLVPITTILATVNWSDPIFFLELKRRAPWRMGGADQFEKQILGQEHQESLEQNIKQDEDLTYRSKESWRYYNKLIGLRSHLFDVKSKSRATGQQAKAPALIIPHSIQSYKPTLQSGWGNVVRDKRHPKTSI